MGQGQGAIFVTLSFVALLGILYWLLVVGAIRDWWMSLALGSVAAGTLGNLYDRLGLPGLFWQTAGAFHQAGERVYAVRDWLHLCLMDQSKVFFSWPIFNLADSFLVCGAAMLLWHAFWHTEDRKNIGFYG